MVKGSLDATTPLYAIQPAVQGLLKGCDGFVTLVTFKGDFGLGSLDMVPRHPRTANEDNRAAAAPGASSRDQASRMANQRSRWRSQCR